MVVKSGVIVFEEEKVKVDVAVVGGYEESPKSSKVSVAVSKFYHSSPGPP